MLVGYGVVWQACGVVFEWDNLIYGTCKLRRTLKGKILAAELGLRVGDTPTTEDFNVSRVNRGGP